MQVTSKFSESWEPIGTGILQINVLYIIVAARNYTCQIAYVIINSE